MVDTLALGASEVSRASSSLVIRTSSPTAYVKVSTTVLNGLLVMT